MEPIGNEYSTGYSEFDNKQVAVFYGRQGPGPLYRRYQFLEKWDPRRSPLYMDDTALDFWAGLDKSRARIS
jgi:hypothetical protein